VEFGPILALLGMVLLIWCGMSRQRARQSGKASAPEFINQQRWLYFSAYGLIVAGLLMMFGRK